MPARQPVRRKPRRQARPPVRPQPYESNGAGVEASQSVPQAAAGRDPGSGRVVRQAPVSPTRMALAARAAELARLDVVYLRHDLRNIAIIAGLMLAIIVALSFVLR